MKGGAKLGDRQLLRFGDPRFEGGRLRGRHGEVARVREPDHFELGEDGIVDQIGAQDRCGQDLVDQQLDPGLRPREGIGVLGVFRGERIEPLGRLVHDRAVAITPASAPERQR